MRLLVCKMYAKVLKDQVVDERGVDEEKCGFMKDRGCTNQTLVVRWLCEKMKNK